jgi:hypothetical protein
MKTRYHSTVVSGRARHAGPQAMLKRIFMLLPPTMMSAVQMPAER